MNYSGGFRGGATAPPPPIKKNAEKKDRLCCYIPFCIRMLKRKAQIARKVFKIRELIGPLTWPWTPDVMRDFGHRTRDVYRHIMFCAT